jgi:AcrR family transcriptional regulator
MLGKDNVLSPRKVPSQERSRKTMAAICKVAANVFSNVGYAETTTEEIAAKAGVSIGTLYHYFSGKEAILYALWEQHEIEIKSLVQQIDQDIRRQGFVNRGIVPILLHLVLELVSHERERNRLFISQIGLPETIIQKRRNLGLYIESAMESIFRDFANVRIRNPRVGLHIIWATVQAVIHDYILSASDHIKPEELIDEFSDMMSRYVFADEPVE